jgi:hypothetical protein
MFKLNPIIEPLLTAHYNEKKYDNICHKYLSQNPAAIHLFDENRRLVDWEFINKNTEALHIIEDAYKTNPYFYLHGFLFRNPKAINLIEKILENTPKKVKWFWLSQNPEAIHLLEANKHLINWKSLSSNLGAIHLLEANQHLIDWDMLSSNPAAIHLFEQNPDKIGIKLYKNPSIFVYDYSKMKLCMNIFREDLMKKIFHPSNVIKWIEEQNEYMLE